MALADLICVHDEVIDTSKPLTIFDPLATWKTKTLENFTARELLVPVFKNGQQVYTPPKLTDVQAYCKKEVATLWDEVKRFENPHDYYVDLSQKLWDIKKDLLDHAGRRAEFGLGLCESFVRRCSHSKNNNYAIAKNTQ